MNKLKLTGLHAKHFAVRKDNGNRAVLIRNGVMDSCLGDDVVADWEVTLRLAKQVNLELLSLRFAHLLSLEAAHGYLLMRRWLNATN